MLLTKLNENIYEIESFLSVEECKILISVSEDLGYTPADVQVNDDRRHVLNVRNNERLNYQTESLANEYWDRLNKLELPKYEARTAIGLSPYFRFYKYGVGQKFNMHKDGRQTVGENETLFSFMIYLNQDYAGGDTAFRQGDVRVSPKTGKGLLFEHHMWHQGSIVESGIKYVLRTDVVYCS